MAKAKETGRSALEVIAEDAAKVAAASTAALQSAEDELAAALDKQAKAAAAYLADPSDKVLLAKMHADHAAAVKRTARDRAVEVAERDAREARLAIEKLEQVTAEAARATKLAALRERTSVEAFERQTAPAFAALLAAEKQLRAAAAAIDAAWYEANDAADELTKLGEPTAPLDAVHLIGGIVRSRAAADPDCVRSLYLGIAETHHLRHLVMPSEPLRGVRTALAPVIFGGALEAIGKLAAAPTPPGDVSCFRRDIDAVLSARTSIEAGQALADDRFRRGDPEEVNRRRVHKLDAPEGFVIPDRAPWAPHPPGTWHPSRINR